jgi:uncharacterized protein
MAPSRTKTSKPSKVSKQRFALKPELLMPKATAIWLIENTALTFEQIGNFCKIHSLEIQSIADGDTQTQGLNPIVSGQLTREEISRCEADSHAVLTIKSLAVDSLPVSKGARYTPIAKRRDKPNAVYWLLRYHPTLTDAQICKLIGTTKTTIDAIRHKTYWNYESLTFLDPVFAGLCRQTELNEAIKKNNERLVAEGKEPVPLYATVNTNISTMDEIVQTRNFSPAPIAEERYTVFSNALDEDLEEKEEYDPSNSDEARAMAEKLFKNS